MKKRKHIDQKHSLLAALKMLADAADKIKEGEAGLNALQNAKTTFGQMEIHDPKCPLCKAVRHARRVIAKATGDQS